MASKLEGLVFLVLLPRFCLLARVVCLPKLTINFLREVCHSFTIAPPRHSCILQGLFPDHMEGSQPLPTSTPGGSPRKSEVPVITTPQVE